MDCWYAFANIAISYITANANAYLTELKDGEGFTHRMGYWKAEEYQRFCYPASEYVIGDILVENEFYVWIMIVTMTVNIQLWKKWIYIK